MKSPARGCALLSAALCCAGLAAAERASAESRVSQVAGQVELGRGAPPAWRALAAGESLEAGDAVRTGRDGRAEILLDGASLRLYGDSLLRLPGTAAAGGAEAVELERGSSLFDVRPGRRAPFEVHSPEVIVSVKGTRFGVDLSGAAAEVAVYRGSVGVQSPAATDQHEVLVREGFSAAGSRGAGFELFLHLAADPWNRWTEGGASALPARRARVFLNPGDRALAAARDAAFASSRPEAIRRTVERRPELAARIAHERTDAGDGPGSRARERGIPDGVAGSARGALRDELRQRALERALQLDIAVVGSSVELSDPALGQTLTLGAGELQQILAGQSALPPDLAGLLEKQGLQDDAAFAGALLQLISRP